MLDLSGPLETVGGPQALSCHSLQEVGLFLGQSELLLGIVVTPPGYSEGNLLSLHLGGSL